MVHAIFDHSENLSVVNGKDAGLLSGDQIQLTVTNAETQEAIDLSGLLAEGKLSSEVYGRLPSNLELVLGPVEHFGTLHLLLQRPPLISPDFEVVHDSSRTPAQADNTKNILKNCYFTGYVSGEQITSDKTFVQAQLCPQLSATLNIEHEEGSEQAKKHGNVTKVRVMRSESDVLTVNFGDLDANVPVKPPRLGHNVASHSQQTDDSNWQSQLAFDSHLRLEIERLKAEQPDDASSPRLRRRRRDVGKTNFLQHIDLETSRFIELYAIVDTGACKVLRNGGAKTSEQMTLRIAEIVTLANAMMSSVNIWIVLVGVELWLSKPNQQLPYNYTFVDNSTRALDGTATIGQLGRYRVKELVEKRNMNVDHVHLFTSESFPEGFAALALIDEFCFWNSATISSVSFF